MVTVTTTWGGGEHAESSLLRAEMNAALRGAAQVESVSIQHATGFVDVKVRLPDHLGRQGRNQLRQQVHTRLSRLVTEAFAAEGLTLRRVIAL